MADDKTSRDKQADDAERRQRERELAEELERTGETEPEFEVTDIVALEKRLEPLEFPATGAKVVEEVGEHVMGSVGEGKSYSIEELVPDTDAEEFESVSEVRKRVEKPSVAESMKRIVEATDSLPLVDLGNSQHRAYEKTLLSLKRIDADDDDEGVGYIADWIVEEIREKEKPPDSRNVRRKAAKFCRENGYEIRSNDWLGV